MEKESLPIILELVDKLQEIPFTEAIEQLKVLFEMGVIYEEEKEEVLRRLRKESTVKVFEVIRPLVDKDGIKLLPGTIVMKKDSGKFIRNGKCVYAKNIDRKLKFIGKIRKVQFTVRYCNPEDKQKFGYTWCVYADNGELLGGGKTKEIAEKRLEQTEFFA